jgi:hypothetical protein
MDGFRRNRVNKEIISIPFFLLRKFGGAYSYNSTSIDQVPVVKILGRIKAVAIKDFCRSANANGLVGIKFFAGSVAVPV